MKNVRNEMEVIINSTDPIQTWMVISGACEVGTIKFIVDNSIDLNNKESIKYGLKVQTFYKFGNKQTPERRVHNFVQRWYENGKPIEWLSNNPWHIPGFTQMIGKCSEAKYCRIDSYYINKYRESNDVCFANDDVVSKWKEFKSTQAARKAAKYIPNPIDHRIKLLKKIMGSNIPMKFAHSILIKAGMSYAPTLFRMWDKCVEHINAASYFEAIRIQHELYCGRDRKKAALKYLGVTFSHKDPNYVDLGCIIQLLQQRIATTEKDVATNFYWFVKTSKKYSWYIADPYTHRRPAEVLNKYCKYIDDFNLGGDIGFTGDTAQRLYHLVEKSKSSLVFSTKKGENTMKDLFPSEIK